ncbi:MAG: hypothetical protein REU00_14655 [Pseudomonadota bacterium]|nr:hypothetical protein [Pseudomonadota bacterium]
MPQAPFARRRSRPGWLRQYAAARARTQASARPPCPLPFACARAGASATRTAAAGRLHAPRQGPTLARFEGKANKGLHIGGKAGDPVLGSADGRVVVVGGGGGQLR